jgi:Tol biopolymer transport system component
MTPERWQQIQSLYYAALDRGRGERATFLEAECGADRELRREVEALLAAHDHAGDFLGAPAVEVAARSAAGEPPLVGGRVGGYEILSPLGAGGMGDVYLAQDTRLGRKVALKLLPEFVTRDEERIGRFKQEARAAAHLSHPNICVVYEVGESAEGRHFIAMELVEGRTLRERLAGAPMQTGEAVEVARQVAEALAAAHEAGIVHRDVKPENVMLRPDGYVKVLDFGIAKLAEPLGGRGAAGSLAPTAAQVRTQTGAIIGTASYMSPEQARGEAVDHRSDVFSFGAVLYEMLTGEPAFQRASAVETMHAVIHDEPPGRPLPADAAGLEAAMRRCLAKDRGRRYQSARELALELRRLAAAVPTAESPPHARPARTAASVGLALGAAAVAGALVWLYAARPDPPAAPAEEAPHVRLSPLTSFPGVEEWPAFSPDGERVAFRWSGERGDNFDIYVVLVGAGAPLRLTTHAGADSSPAWSPDGRYVAFTRSDGGESAIFRVPALGGAEQKLASLGFGANLLGWPPHVVWSPDGRWLAFPDKESTREAPGIFLLSLETLEKRRLTSPPPHAIGDWLPAFSPDNTSVAFVRWSSEGAGDVFVAPVGGEPARLTSDNTWIAGLAWAPEVGIVFSSTRAGSPRLWRIPAPGGAPEPLAPVMSENAKTLGEALPFGISRRGDRIALVRQRLDVSIWRAEISDAPGRAAPPEKVVASTQYEGGPHISPDGERIVFQSERSGGSEIWACRADGSEPVQLTAVGGPMAGTPRWSPDGRQVAFDARAEGHSDIYLVGADGGTPRRLTAHPANDVVPSWSRDGRWVYFASNRDGGYQVWKVPAEGGEAVRLTAQGGFAAWESADGAFVYYARFEEAGVWRAPAGGGEERRIFDRPAAGDWGRWALGEGGIFYLEEGATGRSAVHFFSFDTGRATQVRELDGTLDRGPSILAVSPDGKWLLYGRVDQDDRDIILAEDFR